MLLPKQIWKDIPGYEGKYQVSNTGRVRSLNYNRTGKTKVLKQNTNKLGYKSVFLCKDGKFKRYYIHRLVALAFILNPNNYPIINHKDENPSNNYYKNLEWCTYEYNVNYGNCRKKISEANKGRPTWNKGLHYTIERRKKLNEAMKRRNLILHRDLERQTQSKEQLEKIQQIYSDCHNK